MWAIDGMDQLMKFEECKEVYALYIDNQLERGLSQRVADMQVGFNKLAGPRFHIVFPTKSHSLTTEFKADVDDYNLDLAHEFANRFSIPQKALPMLYFPCLREDSHYLTVSLNNEYCNDAIAKIRDLTNEIIRHDPNNKMTGDEFRREVIRWVKDDMRDQALSGAAIAATGFAFYSLADYALQQIFGAFVH